ncbi:putative hydroxymethylglutaryl-CoA reductase [Staphylococcus piscifermentans]|uniref:3-hydroxy-3-methylglutaryl coenzyme A reductase n=1 Tax=Staphylococcus piscifermentans TaxID=70258 RepID=A0A239TPI6_9STAP|nr:hydroxymethylglutaryl-CoA reductase, degradative [Staphylococcus piscifermentans]RTX84066.1 hydroxymethylglutaryl-CoA reductase, degradative [Staphylococcus piscifermentans]GEP84403.1 3-hydroxy-3-methylglutaryl coenzyme A reductase [Staphylococcus piscifermentans]SNU99465.1 putative hydroxymethylglutaryl-CoA reductase [Staphylococcus piscifermentans]
MKALGKDFRHLSRKDKLQRLEENGWISKESQQELLEYPLLSEEVADSLIENVITQGALPVGLLPDIEVDGKHYAVPMMVEEPSVVAAASYGAKLVNKTGGFHVDSSERLMIGQIVFMDVEQPAELAEQLLKKENQIHQIADTAYPSILKRGGGYRKIDVDNFSEEQLVSLKVYIDTKDAMGANMMNTILEGISSFLKGEWPEINILMSILSNHATASVVRVSGEIDVADLARGDMEGTEVARRLEAASILAYVDPYRAVTHNKGVMNGIHAVVLATGNDTRSAEASAHAYACKEGQYRSMTKWEYLPEKERLRGTIEIPMTLATVGGGTKVVPIARLAQELLHVDSAQELGEVAAAVGLAQNFSACRALVSEGIQEGHMSLQYKSLAIVAGAKGAEIEKVADALKTADTANMAKAEEILADLRK